MIKKKKDFISIQDLSRQEVMNILNLTMEMKNDSEHSMRLLERKSIGLVFQKPSNRTRVSFEVGISKMGGNCIYLGPHEINLGVRESTADVAKTLSRYLDGIVARTNTHADVLLLAQHSTVPVINGLSDLEHPCQALTDIFSVKEKFGKTEGLKMAFIGDGNNMCHSLMIGCAKTGMHMNIATPPGYEPSRDFLLASEKIGKETGAKIAICDSPQSAVIGADVIYADVWVSMGQESEAEKKLHDFDGFQINADLVQGAKDNYIFMHCLPAHRGEEVTADIIDGPHSIVFDQAENRLHTQKAIMNFIFSTW